ncbi:MAG: hypothetical protein WC546_00560 [Candidatus Omnitrophota bacterium]|jgi:hypothetical protein
MKIKFIFLTVFLFLSYAFLSFAGYDYASLVGREVQVLGPYSWERLGVALTKAAADDLIYAYRTQDKDAFTKMLASFNVLRIIPGTKVLVLDADVFKGSAHIVIMSGFYKGMSGWIPVEWLSGDGKQCLSGDKAKKDKM